MNLRHPAPKAGALPAALHPVVRILYARIVPLAQNIDSLKVFFLSASSLARLACSVVNALTTARCRYQLSRGEFFTNIVNYNIIYVKLQEKFKTNYFYFKNLTIPKQILQKFVSEFLFCSQNIVSSSPVFSIFR